MTMACEAECGISAYSCAAVLAPSTREKLQRVKPSDVGRDISTERSGAGKAAHTGGGGGGGGGSALRT